MNNARGAHWNSIIRSRANVLNISEQEAARQVSADVGISTKDIQPKANATPEAKPGFGDEFKKSTQKVDPTAALIKELADSVPGATLDEIKEFIEAEQRKNDDFQPIIDGERPKPGEAGFDQ